MGYLTHFSRGTEVRLTIIDEEDNVAIGSQLSAISYQLIKKDALSPALMQGFDLLIASRSYWDMVKQHKYDWVEHSPTVLILNK